MSSNIVVSVNPGQMALQWMRSFAYSKATCLVRLETAPLEAQYDAGGVRISADRWHRGRWATYGISRLLLKP